MSMSTHIVGIRPAGGTYRKMFEALEACRRAGVSIPPEVNHFFGNCPEGADPNVVLADLDNTTPGVSRYSIFGSEGFDVDLRKLDVSIKIVRFYNSW